MATKKVLNILVVLWFLFSAASLAYAVSFVDDCKRLGYEEVRLEADFTVLCVKTERLELP